MIDLLFLELADNPSGIITDQSRTPLKTIDNLSLLQ